MSSPNDTNGFDGRVAIVTGAGSGIGRMSAGALARDGFALVLAGRRPDALDATRAEIEDAGGRALSVVTDVSDEASVARLFSAAIETFGRVDLLFNNAGVGMASMPLADITRADWDRVVGTNLTGTFLCTRQAFRVMRDQDPQGGRIINNGSISAYVPRPNSIAYTATKHAVTGLTRSTSLDGRKYGIACGQIDIGNAATEMTARMTGGVDQADGSRRAEPRMDAAHVADAVAYMAGLPLDANVQFMTIMATAMPYIGRG
jgi:NAD(P)-dependent dehydrogenase (short-subunit alcohol dehydrogenase family)